jgi:hypothetical protein
MLIKRRKSLGKERGREGERDGLSFPSRNQYLPPKKRGGERKDEKRGSGEGGERGEGGSNVIPPSSECGASL